MKEKDEKYVDSLIKKVIYGYGIEIFQNEEDFWKWMNCHMMHLHGRRPRDLPVETILEELENFKTDQY